MGANAQDDATAAQSAAASQNLMLQREIYNQQRQDFQPFLDAGYRGLGKAENFDLMEGVGPAVDYDKEYTAKLGDYKQSAGFTAQNQLGQQALQRQLNARGLNYGATGASAGAQLESQLTATDYDKYRSDLGQRYKALQGEYALRRDVNQNKYSQMLDMVKAGQGAAGSMGQVGSSYAQQAAGAFNAMGNAVNPNSPWQGLGAASANTFGAGMKGYQTGKDLGWWGGGSTAFTNTAGGYGAELGAASVGPPTAAEAAAIVG